ncbi:tetratricopeptide repeat-containing diguanylate cyclase [Veronia nyctiphanis]|nr:diguanylate cyclase [Veronia nyctiphanis]
MNKIKTSWYFYLLLAITMSISGFILYPSLTEKYSSQGSELSLQEPFRHEDLLSQTKLGQKLLSIKAESNPTNALKKLDELQSKHFTELEADPLLLASFYLNKVDAFAKLNDQSSMEKFRDDAWAYCNEKAQKWLCARVLAHRSYDSLRFGKLQQAEKELSQAQAIASDIQDIHTLTVISLNYANLYLTKNKLLTAKYYLDRAITYEKQQPNEGMKSILDGIEALLAMNSRDWVNAEKYLLRGLALDVNSTSSLTRSTHLMHYFNLVNVAIEQSDYSKARAYLANAEKLLGEDDHSAIFGHFKYISATLFFAEGHLDDALKSINQSLEINDYQVMGWDYDVTKATKGHILLDLNRVEEAKAIYLSVLETDSFSNDPYRRAIIYKKLSDAYERKGDVDSAYKFLKKHLIAKIEYEKSFYEDQIDQKNIVYAEGVKEKDVTLDRTERALKASRLAREQMQNNVLIVCVLLISFLVISQVMRLRKITRENASLQSSNSLLTEEANTDSLTGLHNRRYLMRYVDEELPAKHGSSNVTFTIGILDLDDFKQFNDDYGHNIGDMVLVETARRLESTLRKDDLLVRWGGEEFLCLLQDTHIGNTDNVMQRLCESVSGTPYIIGDLKLKVTLTMGAVNQVPIDLIVSGWESLLHKADVELYHAKQNGKNQYRAVRLKGVNIKEDA